MAVLYTGTARAFSAVFASHLLNLICSSPFTVHLYFVAMVTDDTSDHLSYKATLDRYRRCMNLDGQWVHVSAAIKGWKMQRQASLNFTDEGLAPITRLWKAMGDQELQLFALHQYWAFREVNRLRAAYEQQHSLTYTWVIKMRPDALQVTDVWQSLYHVQPLWSFILQHEEEEELLRQANGGWEGSSVERVIARLGLLEVAPQPLPDWSAAESRRVGDRNPASVRSYLVGDLVFTPRLSSAQLSIPLCDWYGGVNDQFAAGNSSLMALYFERGYEPYFHTTAQHIQRHNLSIFQTEQWLNETMAAHEVTIVGLRDFAYVMFRSQHNRESPSSQYNHLTPSSDCRAPGYGAMCCQAACPNINKRQQEWSDSVSGLISPRHQDVLTHTTQLLRLLEAMMALHRSVSANHSTVDGTDGVAMSPTATEVLPVSSPPALERLNASIHQWMDFVELHSPVLSTAADDGRLVLPLDVWSATGLTPASSSPSLLNSTSTSTVEYLSEMASLDPEDDLMEEWSFSTYSRHVTLAIELVKAVHSAFTTGQDEAVQAEPSASAPPLSSSAASEGELWRPHPLGRVLFSRHGSTVGRLLSECRSTLIYRLYELDERWPTIELSMERRHLSKFQQHLVRGCYAHNID